MTADPGKQKRVEEGSANTSVCLNCGYPVERTYCSNCGQHKSNHNAGVWQFIQEFLEEFVRFDSKLLRTLIPLVTKPGFLTKEWAEGKRARYITPLKLYITISALGFLIVSMRANAMQAHVVSDHAHPSSSVASGVNSDRLSLLDSVLNEAVPSMTHVDPKVLREHFFMHLPTASLLLVPVAAFVFCALYLRPKRYYVEHLVFMLHYNSFCFLTFGIALLFRQEVLQLVAFAWAVGYLLAAIKNNYGQGWLKSILKFGVFSGIYFILGICTMAGTVAVSAYMASMLPNSSLTTQPTHSH